MFTGFEGEGGKGKRGRVWQKIAPKMNSSQVVVMNMCGRGDKDIFTVAKALNIKI